MNPILAVMTCLAPGTGMPAPDAEARRPVLPDGARILLELKDERPDHFGMGMLPLGDIDRDGVTDFYVGARSGVMGLSTGQGYGDTFSGRTGKLLYRIESELRPEGNYFGCDVRQIEDLDGDGIAEIGVNGEYGDFGGSYAQLRSGRDGRLLRHWDDLSIGFGAGDRNGDGRGEVVVHGARGTCLTSVDDAEPRRMFLIDARVSLPTGDFDADGVGDFVSVPEHLRLPAVVRSGRNGHVLASLWASEAWGRLGRSCGTAGDLDGDGFVDVFVTCYESESATRSFPASELRFRLILISGKDGRVLRDRFEEIGEPGDMSAPIDLGDVDADGCSDLLVAHSLREGAPSSRVRIRSGKDDSILAEITSSGWSLGLTAANLGDLDGNGVPEIVLGEHEYGKCAGRAWVISLGISIRKR